MVRLAETRTRVSSYPARRTWPIWWRSAPLAVAWRNAAARVPRAGADLLPVTDAPLTLSEQLFRERPSLW
jgi:hypothetical protein